MAPTAWSAGLRPARGPQARKARRAAGPDDPPAGTPTRGGDAHGLERRPVLPVGASDRHAARRAAGGVSLSALTGRRDKHVQSVPVGSEGENHLAGRRCAVRCAVAQRVPVRDRRSKPYAPPWVSSVTTCAARCAARADQRSALQAVTPSRGMGVRPAGPPSELQPGNPPRRDRSLTPLWSERGRAAPEPGSAGLRPSARLLTREAFAPAAPVATTSP